MDVEQRDLGALELLLQSLGSYSEYLVQELPEGQLLYHYTDLAALHGIVSAHDLWLTNSRFSNDYAEITHGYAVATKVVERLLRSARRTKQIAKRISYLTEIRDRMRDPQDFYVCCFCEEDNLLSQWRSYGAGGAGVSLGFEPSDFRFLTGPDVPGQVGLMSLWRVFYDQEQQEQIVEDCIPYVWDGRSRRSYRDLADDVAFAIQFFVPTFKNEDFNEEKERRLIFWPHPVCEVKPRYRTRGSVLVPYYSFVDLYRAVYGGTGDPSLPLRTVRLGPSGAQDLNAHSVEGLLRSHGYSDIGIERSTTSFRA